MLITELPNHADGDYFLLYDVLEELEEHNLDIFITHAVACSSDREPTEAQLKACKKWLQYQIDFVKPKYILTMGNAPLKALTGTADAKKRRGKAIQQDETIILPTLSLDKIGTDLDTIQKDIKLFFQIVDLGKIPSNDIPYKIVEDIDEIDWSMEWLSLDTENAGLDYFAEDADVYQWTFYNGHGPVYIINDEHVNHKKLEKILATKKIIMHNGKYDGLYTRINRDIVINCEFDTMLASHLIKNNRSHSLKSLAMEYFNCYDWDIELSTKLDQELTREKARYIANDAYWTFELFTEMEQELIDLGQEALFYDLTMKASAVYTDIEETGIYFSKEKIAANTFLKEELVEDLKDELEEYGNVNWNSTQDLAKLLFEDYDIEPIEMTKKGAASTSELALKKLKHPLPKLIIKYRKASNSISKFLNAWPNHIRSYDNRVHPKYKLHGTTTGRPSCEDPNLQQTPRDKALRGCVDAAPGYILIEADLSQIELRVAAEVAEEKNMMRLFKSDRDLHWNTAINMLKLGYNDEDHMNVMETSELCFANPPKDFDEILRLFKLSSLDNITNPQYGKMETELKDWWKEKRSRAKPVNFGFLYEMWYKSFPDYALKDYDIVFTEDEAQLAHESFFDEFPGLLDYHEACKAFVRQHGFITTMTGRRRYIPEAMGDPRHWQTRKGYRQAINHPIQGFAAELNLMVAVELHERLDGIGRIVGTVHDNCLIECKPKYQAEVTEHIQEVLVNPALLYHFGIELEVPLKGDIKIGAWGT